MIRKDELANPIYYTGMEQKDRYPESDHVCQVCGQKCLEDNFPPNYWQYSGGMDGGRFSGRQKYICLTCVTELEVEFRGITNGLGHENTEEFLVSASPLFPLNGFYLTAFDVWREEYKKENGEYPVTAYA